AADAPGGDTVAPAPIVAGHADDLDPAQDQRAVVVGAAATPVPVLSHDGRPGDGDPRVSGRRAVARLRASDGYARRPGPHRSLAGRALPGISDRRPRLPGRRRRDAQRDVVRGVVLGGSRSWPAAAPRALDDAGGARQPRRARDRVQPDRGRRAAPSAERHRDRLERTPPADVRSLAPRAPPPPPPPP